MADRRMSDDELQKRQSYTWSSSSISHKPKTRERPMAVWEHIDEILMNTKVGREFVEHSPNLKIAYSRFHDG